MSEVVYFVERQEVNEIRIGWSDSDKHDRIHDHELYGYGLLAAVAGTYDDEQALHAAFRKYKVGQSRYRSDVIYDYITALLMRGYAASTVEAAKQMPCLPYSVWGADASLTYRDQTGQISLLEGYEPAERARQASIFAHGQSFSDEWFTPLDIIEAARIAMGSIDTDPASCFEANRNVKASVWYSRQLDGLSPNHPWSGNVWLNPPYGRGDHSAGAFIDRLIVELQAVTVKQAVTCLNLNSMSSLWFDPIRSHAAACVICKGRPNFIPPAGKSSGSPTKGTVLHYFGHNVSSFQRAFAAFGETLVPASNLMLFGK